MLNKESFLCCLIFTYPPGNFYSIYNHSSLSLCHVMHTLELTKEYLINAQVSGSCTSANVIFCITCTYCKKLYIGETRRRRGDRFQEHLRDVGRNDKDASKPVVRHLSLPNHSKQMLGKAAVCGLPPHLGSSESRKTLEQKFISQFGTLNSNGINERFPFN